MKFAPKTVAELEAEAAKRGAWPPGVYDAEITTAVDGVSSKGNDMITLTVNVYHPEDGAEKQVKDYLVEAMAFKLRHACDAAGLTAAYESGSLEAWQLEGKPVKVKLGTETYKTDEGRTGTKNKVLDYIVSADPQPRAATPRTAAPARQAAPAGDFDDSIPF